MILDVQQAVDNILQHLVLCLSRQTRGSTARLLPTIPAGALNRQQRDDRQTRWYDDTCGRRS
jgi:hypothetical protein